MEVDTKWTTGLEGQVADRLRAVADYIRDNAEAITGTVAGPPYITEDGLRLEIEVKVRPDEIQTITVRKDYIVI